MQPRFRAVAAVCVLGLLAAAVPVHADVVKEDSPLFQRMLDSAIQDLQSPVTAAARWNAAGVGQAMADFLVTPAMAQGAPVTVRGEATVCKQNGKNYSICVSKKQECTPTIHSQTKTECNGGGHKSVCIDQGTRCPGNGNQNQCLTNSPGNLTHCTSADKTTVCNREGTQCTTGGAGDINKCHTVFPGEGHTTCKSGQEVPTVCAQQATACSKNQKNICKTTQSNDRTSCPTSNHITVCTDAGTICNGDHLEEGCEFASVSLHDPNASAGLVLVSVEAANPGFFINPLPTLQFLPPGPQVEDVTVFDDQTALFYVQVPYVNSPRDYQVFVNGGTGPVETNGLFVQNETAVPATGTTVLMLLGLALLGLGAGAVLLRRRLA